ncbi:hypothetical protein C0993_007462 [Termitomyces sp. T159_Od127]|nr:hypothetical protein C0993_007462 [Termitomyces sp. T159_Od127]
MHNLFLGLIKEHFQGVLGYNPSGQPYYDLNSGKELFHIDLPESPYNPLPTTFEEQSSVWKIIAWLQTPFDFDQSDHVAMKQTVKRWSNVHLASLIYVAKGLGCVSMTVDTKGKDTALPLPVRSLKKVHIAEQLFD